MKRLFIHIVRNFFSEKSANVGLLRTSYSTNSIVLRVGTILVGKTSSASHCSVLTIVQWPVLASLSVSALADIAISVVLCLLFRRMSHEIDTYVFLTYLPILCLISG